MRFGSAYVNAAREAGRVREAYGSDGDYFSKSTPDDVFERIYDMMHESDPQRYPLFYR
jgi:hypothetical protein